MKKKYDLVVKAGTWKGRDGEEKANWLNVGTVLVDDNGGEMYMLNKTFNPAGVETNGRDTVLLYRFEPKGKEAAEEKTHKGMNAQGDIPQRNVNDDEIPF